MSNQSLVTTTTAAQPPSRYNEQDIRHEMSILRASFPKLNANDEQMRALIIAAKFSGLNPFRGEIYYVPSVGIMVASKIKAADAVAYQASQGNTLDIRFERVSPEMIEIGETYKRFAGAVNPGDVAFACRIVSSRARREYFAWRLQLIDEGRALGYSGRELETRVNEQSGPAPEIIALGVVRKAENFGGDTKYSREDRAMKRALQLALNLGGYAAPDVRSYGGVRIEEERDAKDQTLDGSFQVVRPDIPTRPAVHMPDDSPDWSQHEDDSTPRVAQQQPAPAPARDAATADMVAMHAGQRPAPASAADPLASVRATLAKTSAVLAAGTGYPAPSDAMKRYDQLRSIVMGDSRIPGEVVTLTTLDAEPHITSVMHAIKALCEAIIAANEAQGEAVTA